jgi:hypothetical protein
MAAPNHNPALAIDCLYLPDEKAKDNAIDQSIIADRKY